MGKRAEKRESEIYSGEVKTMNTRESERCVGRGKARRVGEGRTRRREGVNSFEVS